MDTQRIDLSLDDRISKIYASYEAGIAPDYDDIESALLATLKDNQRLGNMLDSVLQEFSKVIVPRLMKQDEQQVLAALDDFISRRTSVIQSSEGMH